MKTKVFKFVAVFAFVFAVGASFAAKGVESAFTTGYIAGPNGAIPVDVPCNDTSEDQCTFLGSLVYKNIGLSDPLHKTQP